MTKGKLESTQPKMTNYSTDFSFEPEMNPVELLWENGQLVMQEQSSRARKSSLMTPTFPSRSTKVQDRDSGDAVIPNMGKRAGNLESIVNDFSSSVPSVHVGSDRDDDMARWLNYHIDDPLQNDYYSEFFPELSGSLNSARNNAGPVDKSSSFGQVVRDSGEFSAKGNSNQHGNTLRFVGVGSEPNRFRSSQYFPLLQQSRPLCANQKSRVTDLVTNNNNSAAHQSHCGNWSQTPISASEMLNRKMMSKKDSPSAKPPQPNSSIGLMNFSHFSRPAALVKANLQNIGVAAAGTSAVARLRSSEKAVITGSIPMEPSVVESTSSLKSVGVSKVNLGSSSKPLLEPASVGQSEEICHEDASRNSNSRSPDHVGCQGSSATASVALGRQESEKAFVSMVASSSVCSGNSEPKHGIKRKCHDAEESEFQSEDVEEESVDVKKTTKGSKRSRAAEVHNLSERRRRDRINEKMRALQELIPNCNKVDKASMLDEAIEYLKTLQLQVQIMSMGSGLCMPPMMLPAGLQQMRVPHMAHFSPMGAGMGMGMGYGMGMIDMSCSSGYPLIPVPSMHGARFPCSPVPGPGGVHGMPRTSLQMFGVPGQGLPFGLPRAPYIPLSGFSTGAVSSSDTLVAACSTPIPDSSLPSSSKGQMQDMNSQPMNKISNDCLQIQTSTQVTEECFEQSSCCQYWQKGDTIQQRGQLAVIEGCLS
ncbi:hypothetical protein MRB53_032092 [Persea americana]|uniref:Uncharacterized protein n=1 Tax=Persea americana TaxID=3435 RepID=A0ACC2KRF8_PERAE|nr:hypothetical protein MRB53_032092 [Persea americana]